MMTLSSTLKVSRAAFALLLVLLAPALRAGPTPARELAEVIVRAAAAKPGATPARESSDMAGELLKRIPSRWDESRTLAPANRAVAAVARRSGADWFVGVTGAEQSQRYVLRFDFLEAGRTYTVHRFLDGPDARAKGAVYSTAAITAGSEAVLTLRPDGGAAFWITPDAKRR